MLNEKKIKTNLTSFKTSILIFRFDFDTQEEYANYKSQQEAMPKVGERASLGQQDNLLFLGCLPVWDEGVRWEEDEGQNWPKE